MYSKQYFAYIRVSTARQGYLGTSLAEQRSAIERHGRQKNLRIVKEFQEQETAAKGGRPVFKSMLQALKERRAAGVVMHKIDRSARNLKDWAELGELIDAGIEVHFANENLDLYSRGGRLSADIQAVVAADYIRNLREEVKKGIYGRLKQGFYPMPAPIGYVNTGGGSAKKLDPEMGPLIRKAFELYATGKYSLASLTDIMTKMGLRGNSGRSISINGLAHILHNLFYVGIIHIKIVDEYFLGQHPPLVSKKLFDKVQEILANKLPKIVQRGSLQEAFLFRRLLTCGLCGHRLIGERQKGHVYYRCHTRDCQQKTIREETVRAKIWLTFRKLELDTRKREVLSRWLTSQRQTVGQRVSEKRTLLLGQHAELQQNLMRLTDALMAGIIEKDVFVDRKNDLVVREMSCKEALAQLEVGEQFQMAKYVQALEFLESACLTFQFGMYHRKREVVTTVIDNILVKGKSVMVALHDQFETILRQMRHYPDRESN